MVTTDNTKAPPAAGRIDRVNQARRMRAVDGRSKRQIADHFGVSPSLVTKWLRGIEPPEWTRRPNAKDGLRERARELRRTGSSVPEIAEELGVSRSTASIWVGDIPIDPHAAQRIQKREHAKMMAEARWTGYRQQRDQQRASAVQAAAAMAGGPMSKTEVLRHGALIYWCEGTKSKPWNPQDRVVFINSDPGLISFFRAFLREAGVEQERIQFRVHIHESADAPAAVAWWARHVGVSPESFMPTMFKRHNPKTFRQNTGADYRGCLVIRVRKSRELYWMIEGIVAGALNTVLQHSGWLREAED